MADNRWLHALVVMGASLTAETSCRDAKRGAETPAPAPRGGLPAAIESTPAPEPPVIEAAPTPETPTADEGTPAPAPKTSEGEEGDDDDGDAKAPPNADTTRDDPEKRAKRDKMRRPEMMIL